MLSTGVVGDGCAPTLMLNRAQKGGSSTFWQRTERNGTTPCIARARTGAARPYDRQYAARHDARAVSTWLHVSWTPSAVVDLMASACPHLQLPCCLSIRLCQLSAVAIYVHEKLLQVISRKRRTTMMRSGQSCCQGRQGTGRSSDSTGARELQLEARVQVGKQAIRATAKNCVARTAAQGAYAAGRVAKRHSPRAQARGSVGRRSRNHFRQ